MRVMCTGRVDLSFVLRAFKGGADAVFIGGCHLNECNYTTHGNFYALRMASIAKKILGSIGIDPRRLSIQFISGGEGNRFAELMNEFSATIHELGPVSGEGALSPETLAARLEVAASLVPYVKLLERERFRVQFPNRAGYEEYFASETFERLFQETIGDKLATGQILALLKGGPQDTGAISDALDLPPADVARHMKNASRQGMVRFDESLKRYAIA